MAVNRGRFYLDEVIASTDMDNAQSYLFSNIADLFNDWIYNSNTVILTGLAVTAQSPASAQVNVAVGIASQAGSPIHIPAQQVANILSGSPGTNTWGTGEAAGAQPRIDIVVCQYATQDGDPQTRNVNTGGTVTPETLNVTQSTYYALNVVHGTPGPSPVAPAVPSGWFLLATIAVPASAATITSGDITDNTPTLRTSGGWLNNVSGGILWRNDAASPSAPELDTAAGILLKFGTLGAQVLDNTAAGYLDVAGSTNGVRFTGATLFQAAPNFSAGISGAGSTGALTAGAGILGTANTWSAAQTFSAGITGGGTTGALTAGSGILGAANTWTAAQTFSAAIGGNPSFSAGLTVPVGQTLTNDGTIAGGVVNPGSGAVAGAWTVDGFASLAGGFMDTGNLGAARSGVTSSGTDAALTFKNTAVGGREYWWDSGATGAGVGAGNFALYDNTASAVRMYVDSTGLVHFNDGITGTGSIGALSAPWGNLAGIPAEYPGTAEGLADYNGGHTIKATWTGSAVQFEVDTTPNNSVQQALSADTATSATTASNLGGTLEFEVASIGTNINAASTLTAPAQNLLYFLALVGHVDASATYYFEAIANAGQSGTTANTALWDVTAGAIVSGSTVTTTSTTQVCLRSGAITLVAGHTYGYASWNGGSGDAEIAAARIVGLI